MFLLHRALGDEDTSRYMVPRAARASLHLLFGGVTLVSGAVMVKNLPASAGDTCSIPDPGRSHMPHSS